MALEFSVIGLFMVTLMLGAYNIGNAAQQQIQLESAVRAGGQYAMAHPSDTTGIQSAVTASLPSNLTLSSSPAVTCYCLNPATGATSSAGGCATATLISSCTGNNSGKMVTISATLPYTSISALFADFLPAITATYAARFQ